MAGTKVSLIVRGDTQRMRFQQRAGLVVGPDGPRAAERLLTDDRAGRLVVDVEVAGRVAQLRPRPSIGRAVAREKTAPVSAYGEVLVDELSVSSQRRPGRRTR